MKRNIKKILFMLAFSLSLTSCLNLDPKDQLADGNLWKNADDFKYFANNFYGWTRDFNSIINDAPHSDWRSDLWTSSSINEYSHGSNTIPATDKHYTDNYSRIRRCNILLKNASTYSGSGSIDQYVAEAKFFRAYFFFDLVQLYGDVIITKEPLDIHSPELKATRNPRLEVINFIIKDLEEAATNLPTSIASADNGRATKWAAYALLSRVALFEGTWQKFRNNTERGKELLAIAAKAAKEVIDSKNHELFKPTTLGDMAYKYLFVLEDAQCNPAGLTKKDNKEYIFYRRHDETIAPIGTNITHGNLMNVLWVNRKFINMYLMSDGLPIGKSSKPINYTNMTSEFENRDNRMKNCFVPHGTKYWDNEEPSCRIDWKGMTGEDALSALTSSATKGSGYQSQKWATERKVKDTQEGYDFPIIRYAEVLLNYAEAMYEQDESITDNDLDISLNLVRKRVNTDMPALTNAFANTHALNIREEIRRERTIELFHEGFRIDDLKRWNTALVEMPKEIIGVKWKGTQFETSWPTASSTPRNDDDCLVLESGRTWSSKNDLYPLPLDQTQLNPNLGQNLGWR